MIEKPIDLEGRRTLTDREKREQFERKFRAQRGLCHYCNIPMTRIPGNLTSAVREHVNPQPAGCSKDDRDENIVLSCWQCNGEKGSQHEGWTPKPADVSEFFI